MEHELIEMPDGSVKVINPTWSSDEAARVLHAEVGVALYWYSTTVGKWQRLTADLENNTANCTINVLPPQVALAIMLL